jgi:transcriptional regulator with XRE-family HTH domain
MTQAHIAERLGVSPTIVTNWETGKNPPWKNLEGLAEVLDVSIDWLVRGREWTGKSSTPKAISNETLARIQFKLKDLPESDQAFAEEMIDRLLVRRRGGGAVQPRQVDAG